MDSTCISSPCSFSSTALAPVNKKSPLQLRRQERRKHEAKAKADKTASVKESIPNNVEKCPSIIVSTDNQRVIDINTEDSAVKLSRFSVKEPLPNCKCWECDYVHNTHKELIMHNKMKHRISQVDGINDSNEEKSENIIFSGFDVKEEMDIFIVEVLYSGDDFPEVFTVARAVSLLESLPWPKDYFVISSQPPNYHL